jgi:hypothetical protein
MRNRPYWFAAKRFGWGCGLPLTWPGWLVYARWFAVLLGICYWKGEPARWRWGD